MKYLVIFLLSFSLIAQGSSISSGRTVADPLAGDSFQKSAFGELAIAPITPRVVGDFPYHVSTDTWDQFINNGGSITSTNSMATLSTSAAANAAVIMKSKIPARYEPGVGAIARFTGVFTTGVANSTQWIGIGDQGEGFFFGYNGANFTVMRRQGGAVEIRTLTVATKSSSIDEITITLDGDAKTDVSVTNGADTTVTAKEIADEDFSEVGTGWSAVAVGATVIFTSFDAAVHTGTYSLTDASEAVGSFAQTVAGVVPTETVTNQSSWNTNTFVDFDPTKGNVFQIRYQYLGFGAIDYSIEDPQTGDFKLAHRIQYSNANTRPSIDNPSLPLYAIASNSSNSSDIVLRTSSMMAGIEGVDQFLGPRRGAEASVANLTTSELPVVTIRNLDVFQSQINRTKIKIDLFSVANDHNKIAIFRFYRNATLTAASFSEIESGQSVVTIDSSATAFAGGQQLFTIAVGPASGELLNLGDVPQLGVVAPGDQITITAVVVSGSGAGVTVSANWGELF